MRIRISKPPKYVAEEYQLSDYIDSWFEPTEHQDRFESQTETIGAVRRLVARLIETLASKKLLLAEDFKEIAEISDDVEILP